MKIFAVMNVHTGDPSQPLSAKRKLPLFLVGKPTKAQ
jgi:hypothetical protein